MIRILQINLAGKGATQGLALQKAQEGIYDRPDYYQRILQIGHNTNEANGWYCDKDSKAAIINCGNAQIDEIGNPESGFTWITI